MTGQEAQLNEFLVDVFNDILHLEEASLASECSNLSVSELHVLAAVESCGQQGDAGMAAVAAKLRVTAGTLTAASKTLIQKGYLLRAQGTADKRRVTLTLTDTAICVLAAHTKFHETLVMKASARLTQEQMASLCEALASLHRFFGQL